MNYTSFIILANLVLFCLCIWMSSHQLIQGVWFSNTPIPLVALAFVVPMFTSCIIAGVSVMYLAQPYFSDITLRVLGLSTLFIVAEMQHSIGGRYRDAVIEYHRILGTSLVNS